MKETQTNLKDQLVNIATLCLAKNADLGLHFLGNLCLLAS